MSPLGLFALALLASVFLGAVLAHSWERHERKLTERKWLERKQLLDRRGAAASAAEILDRRARRRHHGYPGRGRPRLSG